MQRGVDRRGCLQGGSRAGQSHEEPQTPKQVTVTPGGGFRNLILMTIKVTVLETPPVVEGINPGLTLLPHRGIPLAVPIGQLEEQKCVTASVLSVFKWYLFLQFKDSYKKELHPDVLRAKIFHS